MSKQEKKAKKTKEEKPEAGAANQHFHLPLEYPHLPTHLRTHTCGELRIKDVGQSVSICGWVHKSRDLNHFCFVDLRDRFGITQVVVSGEKHKEMYESARSFGREWVLLVKGTVAERSNKNPERETGDIEIIPTEINILNKAQVPPFTIEDNTDGNEDIRMKYRYLDIRRAPIRNNLLLRHKVSMMVRNYLTQLNFVEVETPVLIKSTPEGARDFLVPSRMNPGSFYALPQSPQTFKQLLMVGGLDRYYQIVKCFRDEELRSDRQPEFTQIDCEMSFVDQEDVIQTFEGLAKLLLKEVRGLEFEKFIRMDYSDAIKFYGIDKPDLRFGMKFVELTELAKGKGFKVFDSADFIVGICASGIADKTSKSQIEQYTNLAKSPEIGASGLVWVKYENSGSIKSGVDKFYSQDDLKSWLTAADAKPGDMLFLFSGPKDATRVAMGRFRLALGSQLGLRNPHEFKPLWVVNFPLLEYNEDDSRWQACHHPFTSALPEDLEFLESDPGRVRARAYDLVINGWEIGGGSIRIHDKETQLRMLKRLGMTEDDANEKFGFLMNAFTFGAPPHGGLAFGLDRLCSILGGADNIRPFIAFPKNKEGRDTMIDAPGSVTQKQLGEVHIQVVMPPPKEETQNTTTTTTTTSTSK
eukprot:TRINITY_DN11180_c0_g1_i1.p1 TRINITY_DN11180_c0_g1~~TRINITY_DN11180_c0_g1_i1.p1  ORF type:complete len:640 (+),score=188.96 TRINITY_DN11180_c0_g1_i1:70-1989(+)